MSIFDDDFPPENLFSRIMIFVLIVVVFLALWFVFEKFDLGLPGAFN